MQASNMAGKISELLHLSVQYLAGWLEAELSLIEEDWWKSMVLPKLSHQQAQRVGRLHIFSLGQLDLAALLRVLDQNWYHLSQRRNLTFQDRHYVKEMQTVRNRWAHIGTDEIVIDDVYRDIDTIQRFLSLIDANDEALSAIALLKKNILSEKIDGPSLGVERTIETIQNEIDNGNQANTIKIGSIVSLISDPSRQGAVIELTGSGPDCRCTIFIDGKPQYFYLSQLQPVVRAREREIVLLKELHTLLTAHQVKHPSISTLYSLNAARIDFVPYQYRPALKVIHSDQPRLLVADGVGVGKTIEAGLILRELQARNNVESVLVICPKPLVVERKWVLEMKRFDEHFTHLDGKALRICVEETDLEGEWPEQHKKTIIPYSLFDERLLYGHDRGRRREMGMLELDPPPQFDLVIVDEAHHIRNSATFSHQAVRFFCEHAQAVIFLTATPIQLGNQDLFTLLNVLRPDLVIDHESFNHMVEPNPFINEALRQARAGGADWQFLALTALNNAANTSWGSAVLRPNPIFQHICNVLDGEKLLREDRVSTINDIEGFHSLARIINRTRRRDIGDFCIRRPETIEVFFTEAQKDLHDALLKFEAKSLSILHSNQNIPFMMSTIRRQAASCIFGLAPFISDILNRRLSNLEWSETADGEALNDEILEILYDEAIEIVDQANSLQPDDPKFEAFWEIISGKLELQNNKIMVFSSFRHTLAYLENKLKEKSVRVGLIHGDVKDEDRLMLRKRFEKPKEAFEAIDVMLFSEVGCEGLDYQFCDAMVNYDLPWNPMRIEQRIGRIDRRGQKSDVVVIYNLITPGTVDADIYIRCLQRIGIFEQSIGDCEEILGEIHREIQSIAKDLKMTEQERRQKLEQLSDNEVRKINEQRELEDREHELFGISLPGIQADNEIRKSESFWLTPTSLQRFVLHYFEKRFGKGEYILGEKVLKTLRLSHEARNVLLEDFRNLPRKTSPMFRTWEKWLKGSTQHCSITFDSSCAADHRDSHFIMPLHPLVRQAAHFLEMVEPVYTAFKVSVQEISPGSYPFAIYAWEYNGVRRELRLEPVCKSETVREGFIDYLETGVAIEIENVLPVEEVFSELDKIHHNHWELEKEEHLRRTRDICSYRRESLNISHQGRLNILDEQIANATNDKIHKMKLGQRVNTIADFERKLFELEKAEKSADVYARPIVFGVLKVEN